MAIRVIWPSIIIELLTMSTKLLYKIHRLGERQIEMSEYMLISIDSI